MTSRQQVTMLLMLVLVVVPLVIAGKGGGTAVTAEFREPALGGDGDRIDSDGGGPYVDGRDRVSATIQNDQHRSDFVLNIERSPRLLFFEFKAEDCTLLDANGIPACGTVPFPAGTVNKLVMQTRQGDLAQMAPNTPKDVKLHIWFQAPDPAQGNKAVGWFVRFDPDDKDSRAVGCNSSPITITRTSASAERGVWEIAASATDEACLLVQADRTKQLRGRFRMPFHVTVRE